MKSVYYYIAFYVMNYIQHTANQGAHTESVDTMLLSVISHMIL